MRYPMKKLMKRLLNNKGMTLTEMIVAMFLTSVILAIAVGMLFPVKSLMNTMKSNAHMDTINSTVDEYIRGTIQTAKSLKFVQLDNLNHVSTADLDSVKQFCTPANKAKAIAILNVNPNSGLNPDADDYEPPIYRVFELGDAAQNWTLLDNLMDKAHSGLTADVEEMKDYAVFLEPFYEGTSCAVEFYKAGGSRLQVASQCFRDGEMINQKHVLSFNLLNGGAAGLNAGIFNGIEGTGTETKVDPEEQTAIEGHCYLILYTTLEI